MVDVKGRWALITGASRGIGYLSALYMAEKGCNLILHGRTSEHCTKALEEVKALGVEWAIGQARELKAANVPSIHFYSMNAAAGVEAIAKAVY